MTKLKIYFKLWYNSDGKRIIKKLFYLMFPGIIIVLYATIVSFIIMNLADRYGVGGFFIGLLIFLLVTIPSIAFICDYSIKKEEINKEYDIIVKKQQVKRLKEGLLSLEELQYMEGQLSYADEVLNKITGL